MIEAIATTGQPGAGRAFKVRHYLRNKKVQIQAGIRGALGVKDLQQVETENQPLRKSCGMNSVNLERLDADNESVCLDDETVCLDCYALRVDCSHLQSDLEDAKATNIYLLALIDQHKNDKQSLATELQGARVEVSHLRAVLKSTIEIRPGIPRIGYVRRQSAHWNLRAPELSESEKPSELQRKLCNALTKTEEAIDEKEKLVEARASRVGDREWLCAIRETQARDKCAALKHQVTALKQTAAEITERERALAAEESNYARRMRELRAFETASDARRHRIVVDENTTNAQRRQLQSVNRERDVLAERLLLTERDLAALQFYMVDATSPPNYQAPPATGHRDRYSENVSLGSHAAFNQTSASRPRQTRQVRFAQPDPGWERARGFRPLQHRVHRPHSMASGGSSASYSRLPTVTEDN